MFSEKVSIADFAVKMEWDKREVNEIVEWWVQQGCLILEGGVVRLNDDENAWLQFQKTMAEQQSAPKEKGDWDEETEEEDDEEDDDGSNPRIDYMESFWDYTKNMVSIIFTFGKP